MFKESIKKNIYNFLSRRSNNFKNVMKLSTSLFIVQIITYLSSPLITRIYSPESFGLFASYTSIISILTVASTFSYELAINFPDDDESPIYLVWICFVLLFFTAFILIFAFIFIFLFRDISPLKNQLLDEFIFLIPLGMLITGFYSPLYYLSIRYEMFSLLGKLRIRESIFGLFITLISFPFGVKGLILGQLSNQLIGIFGFTNKLSYKLKGVFPLSRKKIFNNLNKYSNYAIFSTSGNLINAIGTNAPYLILLSIFGSESLGYLYLAEKLLRAPLVLFSSSIEKVFLGEAPKYFRSGEIKNIVSITYNKLIRINISIGFILIIIFPPLITTVFGSEWREVSKIIFIIFPMIITDFTITSLSNTFEIINRPKDGFYAQILLTGIRLMPFIFLNQNYDFNYLLISFSFFSCIGYFVYYLVMRRSINLAERINLY